ncbi:MAG: hydrolase [Eubacteriales bacterium]|nr:hydrolase [Eubacteriales bacterium]MDY3333204.1 hydrolase [Gallibacter sp.]
MREAYLTKTEALDLLKKYNTEDFHIHHANTVSCVLGYFAKELGFEDEIAYWENVGLLHDIDFELYPDLHCQKAPELLKEANIGDDMIYSIVSHGYGICSDQEPIHLMEKILFATDELTGLIGAAALMRPSKSYQDMNLKSIKKKFKDKKFAAGCDRSIISKGAEMLGWEIDELLSKTLEAMQTRENECSIA